MLSFFFQFPYISFSPGLMVVLGATGMSEVIDPGKVSVLTAREFQRLIGGEGEGEGCAANVEWEYRKIMDSLVCRHGYSLESAQVKYLHDE